ncbi:MAG: sulfatase [Phycisphaeraceae bacterium]|nr:sulfatase [Phycisphaeraceae bacterium]
MRLMTVACVLLTCLAPIGRPAAAEAQPPNIVFIFSDDHAYQALGAYGSYLKEVVRTPNLDKLAADGMLFKRCMVTNSICGPMRAVIQTGKYSHLNGFIRNGNRFNGNQPTFPKLLQQAGYQTAVIGKWHLGEHQAPQGYHYSEVLIGQGPYYNPPMLKDANGTGDNKQRSKEKHHGYTTDIITDLTLDWLDNGRDKSKPFMLMTQHKAPHREWSPKPEVYETWKGVVIPEPKTLFEDYGDHGPRADQEMTLAKHFSRGYDDKTRNFAPGNLTDKQKAAYRAMFAEENAAFEQALPNMSEEERVRWVHQRYLKIYLASIQSVDENVGRVLKYLEDNGLADNTIVIYSSDQGFYLGEHGWYDKRWAYEESLRTPMIVRWPGVVEPGSVNGDIVSPLDFAQTFLDIAGLDQPDDMQGRSLVPVLTGNTPDDWRESHYYHYYEFPSVHQVNRHEAVCTDRYKLIRFYRVDNKKRPGHGMWELIDLKVDPLEQKNFYDDPAYADVKQRLKGELKRLRKKYQVPEADPDVPHGKY